MKSLFLGFLMLAATSYAGFEGLNDSASLKIFNRINCGAGIECTRTGNGIFNMASTGALENQVSASATTITESQCGSTFINDGAVLVQMELPEASTVIGCRLTFITASATAFLVNPDDGDLIVTLTATLGEAITNATIGDNVTLQAFDDTNWTPVSINATQVWTNAN